MTKENLYSGMHAIKGTITTEKTSGFAPGIYVFSVDPLLRKKKIKEVIESQHGVKVEKVNTLIVKGKRKHFRGRMGVRKDVKKAIVTLAVGQTIDGLEDK